MDLWLAGGWIAGVEWVGWGLFVVVWMVVLGVLFCVLTVVMDRYVYM